MRLILEINEKIGQKDDTKIKSKKKKEWRKQKIRRQTYLDTFSTQTGKMDRGSN